MRAAILLLLFTLVGCAHEPIRRAWQSTSGKGEAEFRQDNAVCEYEVQGAYAARRTGGYPRTAPVPAYADPQIGAGFANLGAALAASSGPDLKALCLRAKGWEQTD